MPPTKAHVGAGISVTIEDGVVQGIIGAGTVIVENLNFYGPPPSAPAERLTDRGEIPPCPYPGLLYFGPQDSGLFFGRDAAIAQLEAAVARQPFTAVIGASGSGKSSLVLAGLAPRLHARGGWRFSHFRVGTEPDQNPFLALSRALVPLLGERNPTETLKEAEALGTELERGTLKLSNIMGGCRAANTGKRILLIADQFEEVFTLVADETRRHRFIDVLLAGLPDRPDGNPPDICLVLTLRADFYEMALRHRQLVDTLHGRVVNLGPMTREELREAVIRPTQVKDIDFETGLVDTLLDAVTSKPGSLPLLQFALREMWRHLEKRCLTRAGYDAIGGIEGAIAQRAQAIYDEQTTNGKDEHAVTLFRRLFTRLVSLGEGREDTRRIVGRKELGEKAWELAQRLAGEGNRLVVTAASAPGHETAEVVHEALIRNWPALIEWVSRDRAFQSWLRQVKPRIDDWREHSEDGGTLLRGGPLAVAEDWLARRHDDLSVDERAYVEASLALRDAERRREEDQFAREQAALKERERLVVATGRTQRRVAWLMVGIGFLVLAMLANLLWQQGDTARREMHIYSSLAGQALTDEQFDRAMRLAIQAYPARGAIPWPWTSFLTEPEGKLAGSALASRLHRVLAGHTDMTSAATFSPDGKRVATASVDHTARLWDAASGTEVAVLKGHTHIVVSAVFSPDSRRIVTGSWDNTARVWDAASGTEIAVLKGHTDLVYNAAFSPDGRRVVTASHDQTARLWDAASGTEIAVLKGHTGPVTSVAFSPDGRRFLTGSWDKTARLWDAASGMEIAVLKGHTDSVWRAAFSPDSRRVVTTSADHTARLWDAAGGAEIAILNGHTDSVGNAAFSPDGRRVVTASIDHTARLWDAASGTEIAVLGHPATVASAAFSPDGGRVLTGCGDNTARLWDAASGAEIAVLKGHTEPVVSAAFSPDGRRVVTASGDHTARLWDAASAPEIAVLKGHAAQVLSAAFSMDGRRIVTASADHTARLWDGANGAQIAVLKGHTGPVWHAAFSPDGRRVATVSEDHTARLWDAASGMEIAVLKGHTEPVLSAAFSPDGRRVVTASSDHTARLWDVDSGREVAVLQGHRGLVTGAAFSPDGRRVATVSEDHTARLWDAASGMEIAVLKGHTDPVKGAAFSPDGRRVVTASEDHTARLWDAAIGTEIAVLKGHTGLVMDAAFSLDGRRVVTASIDHTARLWDAASGTEIAVLKGHTDPLWTAAFSPNGMRVATVSHDQTARLWDAASGTEIAVLKRHTGPVTSVAFSPDGRHLVTGSWDNTARLWDVSWAIEFKGRDLVERVCAEKLVGSAQVFTENELDNPVLRGITPTNPCLRRGPLSLDYWSRLPAEWWSAVRRH